MSEYLLSGQVFFFNDTATTEIYTLSLHDALPISSAGSIVGTLLRTGADLEQAHAAQLGPVPATERAVDFDGAAFSATLAEDRKSTRLNSSHANISYAVFCLNKKEPATAPPPAAYG